jgi:hypothetical protein
VLLVVNEPNEALYLSGRNIPTVAINTAHALQVTRSSAAGLPSVLRVGRTGCGLPSLCRQHCP